MCVYWCCIIQKNLQNCFCISSFGSSVKVTSVFLVQCHSTVDKTVGPSQCVHYAWEISSSHWYSNNTHVNWLKKKKRTRVRSVMTVVSYAICQLGFDVKLKICFVSSFFNFNSKSEDSTTNRDHSSHVVSQARLSLWLARLAVTIIKPQGRYEHSIAN